MHTLRPPRRRGRPAASSSPEYGFSEKTSEIFRLKSKMRKLFTQQHTISDDIGKLLEEE